MKTLCFLLVLALACICSAQAQNTQLAIAQAAVVGSTTSFATSPLYIRRAVADAQGNTYITGIFGGTIRFGAFSLTSAGSYDVFVAKRNAAGTYLWAAQGGGQGAKQVLGMAVDAAGDAVVTGYFDSRTASFGGITLTNASPLTASLSKDVFVAKLSGSSQTWQWAVSAGGGTNINGDDQGTDVAVDVFGNVYVAGTFDSSVAFFGPTIQVPNPLPRGSNVFLAKLTGTGQWVWVKGQDSLGGVVGGVSADPYGDVYLTGAFGGIPVVFGSFTLTSPWSAAAYVAKIDGTGTWRWATRLRAARYAQYARMYAARSDGGTGVYIAGSYPGDTLVAGNTTLLNTGGIDPVTRSRTLNGFVARLHAGTGAWQWIVQTGGNGDEDLRAPQLDGAGHVLVAGGFSDLSGVPSGSTFGPTALQSAGGSDLVVAQLDTAGRWQWAKQAGGASSERCELYGLDGQGHGLILGGFGGTSVQLGASSLLAYPGQAAGQSFTGYTAQLGTNGPLAVQVLRAADEFGVYPNPTHDGRVTVTGLRPGQAVQVVDVVGRRVLDGVVPAQGDLLLSLPAKLPMGLYMVRAGIRTRKLVVE